jgi:hypothetical protein
MVFEGNKKSNLHGKSLAFRMGCPTSGLRPTAGAQPQHIGHETAPRAPNRGDRGRDEL